MDARTVFLIIWYILAVIAMGVIVWVHLPQRNKK